MNAKYDIDIDTESTEAIDESPENPTEATDMDISESTDTSPDIPTGHDDGSRNSDVDISTGDSGQASVTVSGGDVSGSDVSTGDSSTGGNQSGDRVVYNEIAVTDYTDVLLSVQKSLDTLNTTLALILLFLLLSWTEKKISAAVHKFTRERR